MPPRKQAPATNLPVKWDDQLAQYAEETTAMEASTVSSQFISTRGGVLTFNDAQMLNNEMVVIVLDYILENVWYDGPFDPDQPQSPLCFAYGKDEKTMAPHAEAVEPQNEMCLGCPQNQWGTADRGRGKACRNTRRLAMIGIGSYDARGQLITLYDDDEGMLEAHISKTTIALLKLPVTSVKGYSAYVKSINGSMRRPPFAVITKVFLQPHPKDQFHVNFEPIELVPDEAIPAILARRDEATLLLNQPYVTVEEAAPPPVAQPARGGRRAAAPVAQAPARARQQRTAAPAAGGRKY